MCEAYYIRYWYVNSIKLASDEFARVSNNKICVTTNLDKIDKKAESLFGPYDTLNIANASDILKN